MPSRPSILEQHLDIVGVQPDAVVAQTVGITASGVRQWRKKRGIPARWRGEGEPIEPKGLEPSAFENPKKPMLGALDVRTTISEPKLRAAYIWCVFFSDEVGAEPTRVVAFDIIGAAQAAIVLGATKKIEQESQVALAPDICPV
jgi:hypothetical protein